MIYTLERVRYVIELNRDLISMGDLNALGVEGRIGNSLLKVNKGSLVIFTVTKRNGIYITKATNGLSDPSGISIA